MNIDDQSATLDPVEDHEVDAHWADEDPREDAAGHRDEDLDEGAEAGAPVAAAAVSVAWYERPFVKVGDWVNEPWTRDRIIRVGFTGLSLAIPTLIMVVIVQLFGAVFYRTIPTGGDFGAHVWGPAYLRDVLLPSGRINGWSMDWYAGMPVYRFYMVVPAMMVVLFDIVLPYGVALKLVSVLGLVTLPACCWAFGRLANFRYPVPPLMAFAGLCFALDESYIIYGGNLKSTMAGEFSFSIALSFAVLGLGFLAAGLRTGKYRVWTSVLISLACVTHGIVLIYVALTAIVFCVVWVDRERIKYILTVGVTSVLLMMWWVGPFLLNHSFMTDMKYGGEPGGSFSSWWAMFFPLTAPLDVLITSLALVGFVASLVRRNLNGVSLGISMMVFAALVYFSRDSLPVIGLLWNPRVLPIVYLLRYLLMMIGAVELLVVIRNYLTNRPGQSWAPTSTLTAFGTITAVVVLIIIGFMYQRLPFDGYRVVSDGTSRYSWTRFITATSSNTPAAGSGWAKYNFNGYEGRPYYPEYYNIVQTMADLGKDPKYGCGRATWENWGGDLPKGLHGNDDYGTPMALMLLPFWTDGCIGSMEGLFFEASGTTPYHFLSVAALSKQSSNPVRELRYVDNQADVGVREVRDLGVRYVMVRTPEAIAQAEGQVAAGTLELVAESAPWKVYEVVGSNVVEPLAVQPVVVKERSGDQRERRLETGTSWFQQPDEWAAMPADDGPSDWQRIDVKPDLNRAGEGNQVDIVVPAEPIRVVEEPAATVSNVVVRQQSLEFDVDKVGVPVLVKVSYFPNWNASGAEGPYRIGPNMMVVVPTSEHVSMTFGRTGTDYVMYLLTLIGIGLCFVWRRQGDLHYASPMPSFAAAPEHDDSVTGTSSPHLSSTATDETDTSDTDTEQTDTEQTDTEQTDTGRTDTGETDAQADLEDIHGLDR